MPWDLWAESYEFAFMQLIFVLLIESNHESMWKTGKSEYESSQNYQGM